MRNCNVCDLRKVSLLLTGSTLVRAHACALLALALSACMPSHLLTYRSGQPPTVHLPLAAAGVDDQRAAFGALFASELAAAGQGGTGATAWLHGVADAPMAQPAANLRASFAARAATTSVILVPGLFGDCLGPYAIPFGDGVEYPSGSPADAAYTRFADLGLLGMRMAELPGRASSAANGARLAEQIRAEAARPGVQRIVLVAYSKGVADSLRALDVLRSDGGIPRQVQALVSVAGTVMGSPVADYFESLYETLSPYFNPLDCTPSEGGDVASVTRHERVAWLAQNGLPDGIAYYSIVAFMPRDEMAPALRTSARMLEAVDPRNDGQVIAADAIFPRGTLLAEARADHWSVALPRASHPNLLMRAMGSGVPFPQEVLLRSTLVWVVGGLP
jgi:triacylglycerol esterase/lipase EstA (alpha/beta hydrolase family)